MWIHGKNTWKYFNYEFIFLLIFFILYLKKIYTISFYEYFFFKIKYVHNVYILQ